MRRFLAATGAVTAAAAVLTLPVAARATTEFAAVHCKATLSRLSEPLIPRPATSGWALDAFTRKTTITRTDRQQGRWSVTIEDAGTFTTVPGERSAGDNTVRIANQVTGTMHGTGAYTVYSDSAPSCLADEHYNGNGAPRTDGWPLHYFSAGGSTGGINPWHWEYSTRCEHLVKDSVTGTNGNISGQVCPTPTPTPTPTPSPTSGGSKAGDGTTAPGEAPPATPVKRQPNFTG